MKELDLQDSFRLYLHQELERRKATRPNYSLRSFAHFLNVNAGNLNQFFFKRRNLSITTIELILHRLDADPEIRKGFLKNFNDKQIKDIKMKRIISNRNYRILEDEYFEHISDPQFLVFLNLIEIKAYKNSPQDICHRMNINSEQLDDLVEKLVRNKLLTINPETGEFIRVASGLRTSDDISSDAIKKHHKKVIDKSINSIEINNVKQRDITSVTLPVNIQNLPKAKELIREFQDNLITLLNEGETTEVYHLNISLFPA